MTSSTLERKFPISREAYSEAEGSETWTALARKKLFAAGQRRGPSSTVRRWCARRLGIRFPSGDHPRRDRPARRNSRPALTIHRLTN